MTNAGLLTSICAATLAAQGLGQSDAAAQTAISDIYLPAADITGVESQNGESADLTMNILDVAGEVPLYFSGSKDSFSAVSLALGFRRHSFELNQPSTSNDYFPRHLYGVGGSLTVIKSIGDKWYGVAFGSAGLNSDFDGVDSSHLVFEGGAFAVRRFGNLHLGLGPVFTYAFGKPLVLPAPFVRYQGDGALSVEVKFPRYARVRYAVTDGIELGVAARSLYNNYRLGDDRAMGPDGKAPVVVFSDLGVATEASFQIHKPVWLTIGAGRTLKRTLTVNDDSGDEIFDRGMKNGLMFTASVEARL